MEFARFLKWLLVVGLDGTLEDPFYHQRRIEVAWAYAVLKTKVGVV